MFSGEGQDVIRDENARMRTRENGTEILFSSQNRSSTVFRSINGTIHTPGKLDDLVFYAEFVRARLTTISLSQLSFNDLS